MKFTKNENSFELSVIGYQYPNVVTEPYDSNWLVVQLKASTLQGTWSVAQPCLLTYEVSYFADWLIKIASENIDKKECDFFEPLLSFSIVDSNKEKSLRIHFAHEALPGWVNDRDKYFIDFALSELDLQTASDDLRKQLEKYPQRASS